MSMLFSLNFAHFGNNCSMMSKNRSDALYYL